MLYYTVENFYLTKLCAYAILRYAAELHRNGENVNMVISTVSFDGSRKVFKLPDEIMIDPSDIIDDKFKVYRVSLGRADCDEYEAAMYEPLFNAIDKQLANGHFLDAVTINCHGKELTLSSAYVIRTVNRYGRFYDLEAIKEELVYDGKPLVVKGKTNRRTKSKKI